MREPEGCVSRPAADRRPRPGPWPTSRTVSPGWIPHSRTAFSSRTRFPTLRNLLTNQPTSERVGRPSCFPMLCHNTRTLKNDTFVYFQWRYGTIINLGRDDELYMNELSSCKWWLSVKCVISSMNLVKVCSIGKCIFANKVEVRVTANNKLSTPHTA